MYTLQDIQNRISSKFDYSGSAISDTTSEWSRRKNLINIAEEEWRDANFGKWKALFKTSVLTTTGASFVVLPTDYKEGRALFDLTGSIWINNMPYRKVKKAEQLTRLPTDYLAWILGNDAQGYNMYIQPTLTSGINFDFNYYSTYLATDSLGVDKLLLDLVDDITKCPDVNFIVDRVVGELFDLDDDPAKGKLYNDKADKRLVIMSTQNQLGDVNEQNTIVNVADAEGYEPIGGVYEEY